jgi:hypothetical protein
MTITIFVQVPQALATIVGRALAPAPAWTPVFTDRFARVSRDSLSFGVVVGALGFMPSS